jgi:hypothetical protein
MGQNLPVDTIDWLLEGDPSIRWQVMRDLTDAPSAEVIAERAKVARTGWGAALLERQEDDGQWGGGTYSPKWISTTYTLLQLRDLGPDPDDPVVREAVEKVREYVAFGPKRPFFEYLSETCVVGIILALGSYYGVGDGVESQLDRLADQQLEDGGWNCEAPMRSSRSSFNTTILALEGLLAYQRATGVATGELRHRGEEYLLDRHLFRSLSTGRVVQSRWKLFSFPTRWHYDVLRGLDYLRDAEVEVDPRWDEALELVESKRDSEGRWPLQNRHTGREHFVMEEPGKPSRWNTLRSLRVLKWAEAD